MSNCERSQVPLLLTMDLELAPDHDLAAQGSILDELREVFERTGLRLTIFATATAAEASRLNYIASNCRGTKLAAMA